MACTCVCVCLCLSAVLYLCRSEDNTRFDFLLQLCVLRIKLRHSRFTVACLYLLSHLAMCNTLFPPLFSWQRFPVASAFLCNWRWPWIPNPSASTPRVLFTDLCHYAWLPAHFKYFSIYNTVCIMLGRGTCAEVCKWVKAGGFYGVGSLLLPLHEWGLERNSGNQAFFFFLVMKITAEQATH